MASTNNALNNRSTTAIANEVKAFVVSNADDTGTSAAQVQISVGGGTTSGDPQTSYIVTGQPTWFMGCDNSASDLFAISRTTLGSTNSQIIQTNGFNRLPKQPAILLIQPSISSNRTGNGTVFNVGSTIPFYTIVFDKSGNGESAGLLTASITGTYLFTGSITLTGCTVNNGIQIQIAASNRTVVKTINRPASTADNSINISCLIDMDTSDTVRMRVAGLGEAGNTDDLVGSTSAAQTYFTVYLAN